MTECGCVIFEGEIISSPACELTGSVSVPVIYSAPALKEVMMEVTENGQVEIVPDGEFYGLSRVSVTTNVQPPLEEVTLDIVSGSRTLQPSEGFYGISKATVNVVADPWRPNPSWWDIEAIVQAPENQEYPYKCIQLLPDDEVVSSFYGGVAYKTSDGAFYATSSATHTWEPAQDKVCFIAGESTYKTRWVIVYYATQSFANFTVKNNCLYFVMDGIRPTSSALSSISLLNSFRLINGAGFNMTNFSSMFSGCSSLASLPLFDTSKGKSFNRMFEKCYSLASVPWFDTSNGTDFSYMFNYCQSLTSVPPFDTSNGINFSYMFSSVSLTSIPPLDTSNGTNFSYMFNFCKSLTSIPPLDTSNGTYFGSMFNFCQSLTSIPPLDTSNGTDFGSMFNYCYTLTSIPSLDVKGTWINNMFINCTSLIFAKINITSSGINLLYTKLNRESLLYTLDNLPVISDGSTKRLTLGTTNLNKLTAEEKAIATNKGWTLS